MEGKIFKRCGRNQNGFSFLEMLLVTLVISLMFYLGVETYLQRIKESQIEAMRHQANSFSRIVSNLRASALINNMRFVELEGSEIFLNEKGWPANTDVKMSAKSWNQTPEECQQLLDGLYDQSIESVLSISEKKPSSVYLISSINGRICRYELLRKQEGAYFFDYHLSTGEVQLNI